jgi:four helix bundle protein
MTVEPTKTFETLECWKACRELRSFVRTEVLLHFPKTEQYELHSQLLRATRSTTANIAEGYGRYHFLENRKFCLNARGSLYEILDHLLVAEEEGYISSETLADGRQLTLDAVKMLNGYLSWINAQNAKAS